MKQHLILIGGWGFSTTPLQPLADSLSKNYIVHLYDLYELISLHNSLNHWTPPIEIPNHTIVCGWSTGALVAWKIALLHPDKITAIVTINGTTNFLADSCWKAAHLKAMKRKLKSQRETVLQDFHHLATQKPNPDHYSSAPIEHLINALAILETTDLTPFTLQLQIPTLLLHGKQDPVIPCPHIGIHHPGAGHDLPLHHPTWIAKQMDQNILDV